MCQTIALILSSLSYAYPIFFPGVGKMCSHCTLRKKDTHRRRAHILTVPNYNANFLFSQPSHLLSPITNSFFRLHEQLTNVEHKLQSLQKNLCILNDFRYMKFTYLHCGEETNLRDPRS